MLRPATDRLWRWFERQPSLSGFVLVGGTALALHLQHRLSEDLDFAWPAERLPPGRLDAVRRAATEAGFALIRHDDPAALHEFSEGGLELHDYQQDFLANDVVKVSFFAPDPPLRRVLRRLDETTGPRLATLDELFAAKALVSAVRSRTRDWYDLYVLMTRQAYSLRAYHEVFRAAGIPEQAAIGLQRLCGAQPPAADEAFERLAANGPPLEEWQRFFRARRDAFEREEAARGWQERSTG